MGQQFPRKPHSTSHLRWSYFNPCTSPIWSATRKCSGTIAVPAVYKWPSWLHLTGHNSQIICRWLYPHRNIKTEEDASILQQDLDHLQQWESDWKMEFHPKKCQVIHVTNRRKFIKQTYTIHNHTLEEVDSAKYLGVNIHKTLSWNNHINSITNKANSIRAFLQRNIHQCPRKTKELCYKTLVRPIVEYSSIIWDPQTASYTHKLEMVQRRYARFVLGDYRTTSSVTAMISQLQWTTLQERRAQAKAVMMYKIVNNLVDVPHTFLAPCTVSLRGHSYKYMIPFTRTGVYTQSFFPNSIRIWNNLPVDLINCTTLASFKQGVQSVQLR